MDAIEKQAMINEVNGNQKIEDGTYTSVSELRNTYKVKVKGKEPTSIEIVLEKGKIKSANFTINKYQIECTGSASCNIKGEAQVQTANAENIKITINNKQATISDVLDDLRGGN